MSQLIQKLPVDLSLEYLGNSVEVYIEALILFVGFALVFALVQWVILLRLQAFAEKTKTDIDDVLVKMVKSFKPPFYFFLAFYIATLGLEVESIFRQVVNGILLVWVAYQIVSALSVFVDYLLEKRAAKGDKKDTKNAYGFLGNIVKGALWVVALLMVLSNLGVDVTSLIAGLGIGGIAIAFALQNILADLFSSFAIYFDKPFEVGDMIVVGEFRGTVEKIGIKSTRIRSLQGEEIVIANQDLMSARLQNFRKLTERRVVFGFGILYETPTEKTEKIPEMVKAIVEAQENARFDRTHFKSFGDSALDFEVVYYVPSDEYKVYMDTQEAINLGLMRKFEEEGIEFAYPTQTLYIKK